MNKLEWFYEAIMRIKKAIETDNIKERNYEIKCINELTKEFIIENNSC